MKIKDKIYDIKVTFKNIMKIFKLFEENNPFKVKKSLELLGIEDVSNPDKVLNDISHYLFGKHSKSGINLAKRNFDLNLDYKYYFVDFLRLGINLNSDDISWWEFKSILDAIFLDDKSTISKVITYRTYEKPSKSPKIQQEKEHRFYMEMKRKYSLPNMCNTENGFEKLWNYVEKKVGE